MFLFRKTVDSAVTDYVTAAQSGADPNRLLDRAAAVAKAGAKASPEERQAGLQRLADFIEDAPLPVGGCVAVACGALVEYGADPRTALPALLGHARTALRLARGFAEACVAEAPPAGGAADGDDPPGEPVEEFGERVAARMPMEAFAYSLLEPICLGAIAMLSRSKPARREAHADAGLRESADALAPHHGRADFFAKMLRVLDDEELVVLHPETGNGYRVRIGGIADNFQLQVLLAEALAGRDGLPGERPTPAVLAAFIDGPPIDSRRESAQGAFNLFNWTGLRPDGTLPEGFEGRDHWVWNEGVPDDIVPFEGRRVVLVGPPPYPRFWNACRIFDGMRGELAVVEKLSAEDARGRLTRIAARAGG